MNVFVLCTGRCGSTTFVRAASHIENYSAAHESRAHMIGVDRFSYPDSHIEADNRLSWLLGRLDSAYGNDAFYVHLTRNTQDTAASYVRRYDSGIMKAYRGKGIMLDLPEETDPLEVALDYCSTVEKNISMFLENKSKKLYVRLEDIEQGFQEFWQAIGATGNRDLAMQEFSRKHNSTEKNQRKEVDVELRNRQNSLGRVVRKVKRAAIEFPEYLKNV